MRYAAIDIGSNAVRLLIVNIVETESEITYKKDTLIRVPLRLGDDAFLLNELSDRKIKELSQTMTAFKNLMDVFKVDDYRAYATSAMREAKNGPELIKKIKKESGIKINIITGDAEAKLIYTSQIKDTLDPNENYLYVDVGGGSTEISVFTKGKVSVSHSFNIGTIRMLDNKDTDDEWEKMRVWIRESKPAGNNLKGIGTGGNINKLFRLSGEKEGTPVSYTALKDLYNHLNSYSLKERIKLLGLNQDRADVIIPASEIYLSVMKWAGVKQMYVPKVGLVDGIISQLINKNIKA